MRKFKIDEFLKEVLVVGSKVERLIKESDLDSEAKGALIEDLVHIKKDFKELVERYKYFLQHRKQKPPEVII